MLLNLQPENDRVVICLKIKTHARSWNGQNNNNKKKFAMDHKFHRWIEFHPLAASEDTAYTGHRNPWYGEKQLTLCYKWVVEEKKDPPQNGMVLGNHHIKEELFRRFKIPSDKNDVIILINKIKIYQANKNNY